LRGFSRPPALLEPANQVPPAHRASRTRLPAWGGRIVDFPPSTSRSISAGRVANGWLTGPRYDSQTLLSQPPSTWSNAALSQPVSVRPGDFCYRIRAGHSTPPSGLPRLGASALGCAALPQSCVAHAREGHTAFTNRSRGGCGCPCRPPPSAGRPDVGVVSGEQGPQLDLPFPLFGRGSVA